jgi:serine/threonine protein kinase
VAQEGRGLLIGQTLGGYHLTSLLGVGGMAEVYLARDPRLRREVAVKVLPAMLAADPEYVKRFMNEARQVAAIDHPNIVPVYFFDSDRGLLFLVMPVMRGSLRDRLDHERVLSPDDAVELTAQIASGLHAAHQRGLVHRDVKPENILLDAAGNALLSDFGIARQVNFARHDGVAQTLAATGLPVGTPEYMAPEQLRSVAVDHRADIYALGSVLYELLTGVVPHDAPSPYEVAALVLTEPLIPPAQRNPAIWPALEAVVLRAMAAEADDRYQDAALFAAALRQALAERTRDATQVNTAPPTAKTARISRRFTHATQFPGQVAPPAQPDAPTLADLPTVGGALAGALARATGGWSAAYQPKAASGRRWLAIGALAALLLVGACGLGVLHLLGGGSSGGDALTPGGPGTATLGVISTVTPTPTATPRPTSVPTQPPPTATTTPSLTITPQSTLELSPSGKGCQSTTQYIVNNRGQTIGWAWQPPTKSGYTFSLNGAAYTDTWPSDASPGIAAGGTDALTVRASSFACFQLQGQPLQISVRDTQGNTYTFTLKHS